jgi:hypothetical protein
MVLWRIIPAGDLDVRNGKLVLLTGAEYARQKMAARFRFFLGEWFLDRREGVPYAQYVFVKNPNIDIIRSIFRRVAMSVEGVVALPNFDVIFTESTRTLAFNFTATFDTGLSLVVTPLDELFIIPVDAAA